MERLKGPDRSIEISLREYGIAWEVKEEKIRFYVGVRHSEMEFTHFDWVDLENSLDVHDEYDWADFGAVARFSGMSVEKWDKMSLVNKIQDLVVYHGIDNVFGASYAEGMTYEEVVGES